MNERATPQFHHDAVFVACRELWCAVIMQAWKDALSGSRTSGKREKLFVTQARRWFGSADFYHVCALAGVDGEKMLAGFLRAYNEERAA